MPRIKIDEIIDAFIYEQPVLKMKQIKDYVFKVHGNSFEGYASRYSFDQTIQRMVEIRCRHREGFNGVHVFDLVDTGIYKLANPEYYEKIRIKKPDEILIRSVANFKDDDQEETTRKLRSVNIIQRNKVLVAGLKKLYDNKCQLCNKKVPISDNIDYSEVHHIKPLGEPHNGPDTSSNMIVVCPNCHVQLDYKYLKIIKEKLTIITPHKLDDAYLEYHNSTNFKQ